MFPRAFVLFLLHTGYLLFTSQASSPPFPDGTRADPLGGTWTDGYMVYRSGKGTGNRWLFSGANLHEGGYSFVVKAINDSNFVIGGRSWEEEKDSFMNKPSFGHRNDRLVLKKIGGKRVLIALTPSGACSGSLLEESQPFELDRFVRSNRIKYQLSGKYTDSVSGTAVTFKPDQPIAEGVTTATRYQFAAAYDFVEDVLIFANKKAIYYVRTDAGLDLFEAVGPGDEEYSRGKKLMTLLQRDWFDLTDASGLPGHYSFASTIILTDDILGFFTARQMKILRNEIYARHGYVFRTPDMKNYFEGQPWYQPRFSNVDDQLTDLERLNLFLIRTTSVSKADTSP